MFEEEQTGAKGGISGPIRRLAESATGFLTAKLELAGIELQEEKRRILKLLILAATTLIFFVMSLTILTFTVVAVFWDTHRWAALFSVFGIYTLVTICLAIRLQRTASIATRLFEDTVGEFKKDTEWLKRHL